MKELSLHILDVAENSLRANASLVQILIVESTKDDSLKIVIIDDGCGMTKEYAKEILNPFVTERKTRKVGMGIPLFADTAKAAGGELKIESYLGKGTTVEVFMRRNHIDRPPLGDIASTLTGIICNEDETDVYFMHKIDELEYYLDTREIRETMGDIPLCTNSVLNWIKEFIKENETKIGEEIENEISS
jgi:hypothetical protein